MSTEFNISGLIFSAFSIFGLLFTIVPIVFFLWFAITTTKQLKKQTIILEEIREKINR